MRAIIDFIRGHPYFTVTITGLNLTVIVILYRLLKAAWDTRIQEAKGGRGEGKRVTRKITERVKQNLKSYEKREKQASVYLRAKEKVKKSGYRGEYAAVIYLIIKYCLPIILFIMAWTANFPDIKKALLLTVISIGAIEYIMWRRRKEIAKKLQMSAYKIYKFLHNQISSGIKVSDAVKSIHEIIEDKHINQTLLELSVHYQMTLDIGKALATFQSNFASTEADALAVAIKQGIDTGDNQNILEKQEKAMFRKYINYIQAETKSCQFKSLLSVTFFISILIIMYAVPMFRDIGEATNKIFITP